MKQYYFFLFLVLFLYTFSCKKENLNSEPEEIDQIDLGSPFVTIIQDEINEQQIVLAGSSGKNFIVSFYRMLEDSTLLTFESTEQALPIIMVDDEGNSWDVFGKAVSGPRTGERLMPTRSCMGYWYAFNALYPGAEIYNGPSVELPSPGVISAAPGWAISTDYVLQALSFGVVPSLDYPSFLNYDSINYPVQDFYVQNNDLVVGYQNSEGVKAYPHNALDYHEVINDNVGEEKIAVLYCPLTGTAQVWKQEVDGIETQFGVSGFLYNSNLMPTDMRTESIWTQLGGRSVFGTESGARVDFLPFIETTWSTWKEMFENPLVLSEQNSADRDYRTYPYGDFKTNHNYIAFPVEYQDDRILAKERVHGIIINNEVKVYQLYNF